MGKQIKIEAPENGRRRRYTPEQKRALLDEAARPGASISAVARTYGIAPSVMFLWRRTMDDASEQGLKANERVVPESEVKKLEARIKELERALGRKTMENEILQEALKLAGKKKRGSHGGSSKKGGGR
jgi:transposase